MLSTPLQKTDRNITYVQTGEGIFAPLDPFSFPPGTNLLPTVYTDLVGPDGKEVINTLPSRPDRPYNLHSTDPVVTPIDATSPTDDLRAIFDRVVEAVTVDSARSYWLRHGAADRPDETGTPLPAAEIDHMAVDADLALAIDILEGNPVPGRTYSGFPLLHYKGPQQTRKVRPVRDDEGRVTGGNIDVHQVWYDSHIESDTIYLDPSELVGEDGEYLDVGWTVTYTVDVLSRGADDFSPFTMFVDSPGNRAPSAPPGPSGPPKSYGFAMDQTFYPMNEGTRTVFTLKMPPPARYKLTYTWGWRQHPPRVQAMENATAAFPPKDMPGHPARPVTSYEQEVFGGKTPEQAIAMISDLAPAKRMWTALRSARRAIDENSNSTSDFGALLRHIQAAYVAFHDWQDRNHLPSGVRPDPDADLTLLYVDNTLYGEFTGGGWFELAKWRTRGTEVRITIRNGDYYEHAYMNVDFGGARGWENQYMPTQRLGGSGCEFSFGRVYWSQNLASPLFLPPATHENGTTTPTEHKLFITYNFDPGRRLRFYQFDPMHHNVAVFSVH